MKKKILIALGVAAGLVIVFLVIVALQPAEYQVNRSAAMAAPPSEVFAQVNDFHNWEAWSPWIELDPDAKTSYEGPDEGEGATFRWSGNAEVGEGTMTIVESRPAELVRINLQFVKPFEDRADVEFAFQPRGDQTLVTWKMSGRNNFLGKAMCLLMDMDEMVGGSYEKGLANMKQIVEGKRIPSE